VESILWCLLMMAAGIHAQSSRGDGVKNGELQTAAQAEYSRESIVLCLLMPATYTALCSYEGDHEGGSEA